ncbi:MAG: hypothetical protein ABH851_07210, partial [Methanobacteriota archaeon]
MKKPFNIRVVLLVCGLVLLNGCIEKKSKYVECLNGQLVMDLTLCPTLTTTLITTTSSIITTSSMYTTTSIDPELVKLQEQVKKLEEELRTTSSSTMTQTSTSLPLTTTMFTTTIPKYNAACCSVYSGCDAMGTVDTYCGSS